MDVARLLDGRLKLRHLVLVDILTTQGSVIGAAKVLHVTQPVVTRSLQDLEHLLGVQLFERGPKGITPTEFGTAFTGHARAVIAQLGEAARHVGELASGDRGSVVVGTHLAGSNLLIPRAIAAVKAVHPTLTVTVREAPSDLLLSDLESGRVDVVVGRLTGTSSEGYVRKALYQEVIRVVVGAHHPFAGSASCDISDLAPFPWILPGPETVLRRELETYFMENGFELPPNRVETTSFLTMRQLLLHTDTVAAMPELIAKEDPRITRLPVPLGRIGHTVGLTLRSSRRHGPATEAMLVALRATARDLAAELTDDATSDQSKQPTSFRAGSQE